MIPILPYDPKSLEAFLESIQQSASNIHGVIKVLKCMIMQKPQ